MGEGRHYSQLEERPNQRKEEKRIRQKKQKELRKEGKRVDTRRRESTRKEKGRNEGKEIRKGEEDRVG